MSKEVSGFGNLAPRMVLNNSIGGNGWTKTNYGHNLNLSSIKRTEETVGANSKAKFGTVKRLNPGQYLIKKIIFGFNRNSNSRRHIFNTEVRVGSLPNIGKVGPKVYAHKKTTAYGEYIMNNVARGRTNGVTVVPLALVYEKLSGHESTPGIWKIINKKIKNFQRIVRGQHGDLHGYNILLVQNNKGIEPWIIDYGAVRTETELRNIKSLGKNKFDVNVYKPGGLGQLFRCNNDCIREHKELLGLLKRKRK